MKPQKSQDLVQHTNPFLYVCMCVCVSLSLSLSLILSYSLTLISHSLTHYHRYKLVGSIGFSPHPLRWREFLTWVRTLDIDTFPAVVDGLVTTDWYQKHEKKTIWTQLFIYFCNERNLYTLYSYHKNKETLAGTFVCVSLSLCLRVSLFPTHTHTHKH